MNRRIHHYFTIFLCGCAALLFTACGGGGGGGGTTTLATGGFVKAYGTAADSSNAFPFSVTYDTKVQYLYTPDEINGSGNINALQFRMRYAETGETCPNMTIRMGHTNLTALTTTFANNVETGQGSLQTVLNDATVTIPAGAAESWFEIPLTTSFYYNGQDNLVVEFATTTACSGDVQTTTTNVAGRRAFSSAADTTAGTADNDLVNATVDDPHHWMKFAFAGGDNSLRYPGALSNSIPFSSTTATYNHVQMLHLASDINGSGPITGIAMINAENPTDAASYTVNIKLGHTTLSALTTTFADNFDSGTTTTVASGLTFEVPAGVPVGVPIWLPLTGSFDYNGTDNLIVDIEVTSASADTFWRMDGSLTDRRVFAAVGDTTGTVQGGGYHTVFRFNGGPVVVMQNELSAYGHLLGGYSPGGQIQSLYRGSDLGTNGTINSVAYKLTVDSTASSVPNYTVYMGHTTKTALLIGDTYASNMDDQTLVYSGTFNVPAGLKAGDWVTIPLQTSFNYDITKNLTVLVMQDVGSAGTSTNTASFSADATRYASCLGGRDDNSVDTTGTPAAVLDAIANIRLGVTN